MVEQRALLAVAGEIMARMARTGGAVLTRAEKRRIDQAVRAFLDALLAGPPDQGTGRPGRRSRPPKPVN
jgi:hypothetical protein